MNEQKEKKIKNIVNVSKIGENTIGNINKVLRIE